MHKNLKKIYHEDWFCKQHAYNPDKFHTEARYTQQQSNALVSLFQGFIFSFSKKVLMPSGDLI